MILKFYNTTRSSGNVSGAYVDDAGNTYANISNNNGSSDGGFIVQKIAPNNTVTWSHTFPNAYGGSIGLTADSSSNIYTGGFYGDAVGDYYTTLTKFDPSGTKLWQRRHGGSQTYGDSGLVNQSGYMSTVSVNWYDAHYFLTDASGNTVFSKVRTAGAVMGQGMPGIGPNRAIFGYNKYFWVYTLSGTFLFGKDCSSVGLRMRATADSQDSVYSLTYSDNNSTVYLTKWDSVGNKVWDRQITSSGGYLSSGLNLKCDANNNVYVPIWRQVTGGNTGTARMSLVSFDKDGNTRYQRAVDVSGSEDIATAIEINNSSGRGILSGYVVNGRHGAVVTFDLATGNTNSTATIDGYSVSFIADNLSITTPASLSYASSGDPGSSSSLSPIDRGSSGGNTQYTVTRATFA